MGIKLSNLSMISISLPVLLFFGAVSLFAAGYLAHKAWGANNKIEEIAEELLWEEYGVEVEFSGDDT